MAIKNLFKRKQIKGVDDVAYLTIREERRIERAFRDIHQARGHIANNTDAYARAHGAVMLGLPNGDPYI